MLINDQIVKAETEYRRQQLSRSYPKTDRSGAEKVSRRAPKRNTLWARLARLAS